MELLFRQDAYLRGCDAIVTGVDAAGIRLDRTVFYPMGGGQPGDVGALRLANGETVEITDTVKGAHHEDVVHVPKAGSALPQIGDKIHAEIDWERRYRLMRMHTCLHLLSAVIKGDVTGGQVSDGKGRLDFNLPDQSLDKDFITREINRLVSEDHEVQQRWITDAELAAQPELVRTMSVKPPSGGGKVRLLNIVDVDLQPCGGTHVARTGEVGAIEVTKIENKGKMNRRVNLAFVVTGGL
jgi:misacylated tRNA(Ala) deacylase